MLLCVLFAVYDVPKVADQKQVEAQQQDPTQEPEGHEVYDVPIKSSNLATNVPGESTNQQQYVQTNISEPTFPVVVEPIKQQLDQQPDQQRLERNSKSPDHTYCLIDAKPKRESKCSPQYNSLYCIKRCIPPHIPL
jgi:hypothetical protein